MATNWLQTVLLVISSVVDKESFFFKIKIKNGFYHPCHHKRRRQYFFLVHMDTFSTAWTARHLRNEIRDAAIATAVTVSPSWLGGQKVYRGVIQSQTRFFPSQIIKLSSIHISVIKQKLFSNLNMHSH